MDNGGRHEMVVRYHDGVDGYQPLIAVQGSSWTVKFYDNNEMTEFFSHQS